jgi:virginiamycin B lyase
MQSSYALMLIFALSLGFLEPQDIELWSNKSSVCAAHQHHCLPGDLKGEQLFTKVKDSPFFYPTAYAAMSNTSLVYSSPKSQEMVTNNVSKVVISNGLLIEEFPVPSGSQPHDVAPSYLDSKIVWYTAQALGDLGKLDTQTGKTHHIHLGQGSAPHGVIVGPDGSPWVTDGGLNAIVRVDRVNEDVKTFALPEGFTHANLNTATFDKSGTLWFTGQSGFYGRLHPSTGLIEIFKAPKGPGPYGISTTPNGTVYFASLAGSYIARVNPHTGAATVIDPPTPDQGARRVWPDSHGNIWVSEWNAGKLGMYNSTDNRWKEWQLPGDKPMPYAVYVDEKDMVWLSDFGANAFVRFDPKKEIFETFSIPTQGSNVRQILGKDGIVWGAESGSDKIVSVHANSIP